MIKERIISVLTALLAVAAFSTLMNAQSPMYFANNPDGPMPVILFPQGDDGLVGYSKTIPCKENPEDALGNIEDALNELSMKKGFTLTETKSGRSSLVYNIETTYGNQPWGFDMWGSPLFRVSRDATKVKYKCLISDRDGEIKIFMSDFETDRNTLRGAAKNDGDPNIIQWQRVNSQIRERNEAVEGKSLDKPSVKGTLFDYNTCIAFQCLLYCEEYDMFATVVNTILKSINSEEKPESLPYVSFNCNINELATPGALDNLKERFVWDNVNPEENASLANGRPKVYVTGGEHEYEIAGQNELRKQIVIGGKAYVTFQPDNADYTISYIVNTEGRDKAHLTVTDANGVVIAKGTKHSDESDSDNREVAASLYKSKVQNIFNNGAN